MRTYPPCWVFKAQAGCSRRSWGGSEKNRWSVKPWKKQNHPNSLEIVIGVTANLSISYFYHAKFQILLKINNKSTT